MEKFTFFYRSESPFSQWYPAYFVVDGITFRCTEQYMMYKKAVLFGDREAAAKILGAKSPGEQKALGRAVKSFDRTTWEAHCKEIVYEANRAKFTQNQRLLHELLSTRGTTLVEASPTDRIWGVGLAEDDPRIRYRQSWQGTNWLGEILTRLRDDLIESRQRQQV